MVTRDGVVTMDVVVTRDDVEGGKINLDIDKCYCCCCLLLLFIVVVSCCCLLLLFIVVVHCCCSLFIVNVRLLFKNCEKYQMNINIGKKLTQTSN